MRLTQKIREEALINAIKEMFKKRAERIDAESRHLAQVLMYELYPENIRSWLCGWPEYQRI